jgi:hypothetical protein
MSKLPRSIGVKPRWPVGERILIRPGASTRQSGRALAAPHRPSPDSG